jgi:hypothetical protein
VKSRLVATVTLAASALLALPAGTANATPTGGCSYPPSSPRLTTSVWRPHHKPAGSVTVFKGGKVNVSGFYTQGGCGIASASVVVVFRAKGSTHWSKLGSHLTNTHGSYVVAMTAQRSGDVRADFSGGGRFGAQDSAVAHITVAI